MITLTVSDVLSASTVLQKLSTREMSARTAYRVARLMRQTDDVLQPWHETRRQLIKRHGSERPSTDLEKNNGADDVVSEVVPGSQSWNAFQQELKTLLSETVTIEAVPLVVDELPSVSPSDLLALGCLVEDGDGSPKVRPV